MNEKWYGEKCNYQICQFEKDGDGVEDRTEPILIFCNHNENKKDCEGNCNQKDCPVRNK